MRCVRGVPWVTFPFGQSVGEGGRNKPADVAIVQDLFNRQRPVIGPFALDGISTPALAAAVRTYQTDVMKSVAADGRIDAGGGTIAKLLKDAIASGPDDLFGVRRAVLGPATRTSVAVDLYTRQFATAPPNLTVLLNAMIADVNLTDIRWAAYMIGTARIETGSTLTPIEEIGAGAGHDYGLPAEYVDSAGNKYGHVYYGRGYVQLTWLRNYLAIGQALGLADQLAIDPAKALDPTTAYNVMSHGMRNGVFTGRRLSGYISGTMCDYPHARRIINGMDRAYEIAAIAEAMEILMRVASI